MTPSKRIFDIILALTLSIVFLPVLALILLLMWIVDGRPFFFSARRMRSLNESFSLIKIRTMQITAEHNNGGVSGGHKAHRVTKFGNALRRSRLDEIPQLWNVLKGDISFVGPRPPLPQYVEKFPEVYGPVLKNRPGITGLASVVYHRHEERLLDRCKTAAETEQQYIRRCIPRKARLDLMYQDHRSMCGDIYLILWTGYKFFTVSRRK